MNGVPQRGNLPTSPIRGRRSIGLATAAIIALLATTACKEEAAPAPEAAPAAASNSDLFRSPSKPLPPPPAASEDAQGSSGPGASAGVPPLIPVLDPAVQKECDTLKKREKELRAESEKYRNEKVAPASAASEKAYEAFAECQLDYGCTNNESQYGRLNTAMNRAEASLEKLETELMIMEGELHDVSQSLARKCGDF